MTNSKIGAKIPVDGNWKYLKDGKCYDYDPRLKPQKLGGIRNLAKNFEAK